MQKHICTIIATVLLLFSQSSMGQSASRGVKTPDFAYPKTVIKQSDKALSSAMRNGDDKTIVRSLLDYALAGSAIGNENIPKGIAKIDSVTGVSNDPVLRGMLSMLEAYIYNSVYAMNRWVYDQRNSPLEPVPADYDEWSGEQFRHRIESLLDVAIADSTALRAVPLRDYKGVITQDRQTEVYYPTLYDFVASQALTILEGWGNDGHCFPLWMARSSADSAERFSVPSLKRDPRGEKILAIYSSLLSGVKRGSATDVNTRLARLMFLRSNVAEGSDIRYSSINPYNSLSRSLYMELYESYLNDEGKPSTEYAGDILLEIPSYGEEDNNKGLYDTMTAFMNSWPGYWRRDCIKRSLNDMSRKRVNLNTPQVIAPGREFDISVSLNNVERMTVDIYDVSSAPAWRDDYELKSVGSSARKIASLPVSVNGERVPFRVDRKIRYSFPKSGNYIVVPVVNGVAPKRENYQKIHVTTVALGSSTFLDRTVWAVDANDGSPLEDVVVSVNKYRYRDNDVSKRLGVTGADGSLSVNGVSGALTATKGDDGYALPLSIYDNNYTRPDKWIMAVRGYPSLPLYHQGDTVEWTAICYEFKGGLNRPCPGKRVQAVMYDANSMAVDTLMCETDRFGRACGKFTLPASGLTGWYHISIDKNRNAVRFQVSDYKLPTFHVLEPEVERGVPAQGDVTLRGKVQTYSGFPVADAELTVALSVTSRPRWWYPSRVYDVYSTKVRTDGKGEYEVVFTDDIFVTSPLENGYYTASVTALSSTGESQTGSVSFSRGERYIIKAVSPANFDISGSVELPVEANLVNYEDSTIHEAVNVRLVRNDSTVAVSSMIQGKGMLAVGGCEQGRYNLVFTHEDADSVVRELVLYDRASAESPCPDNLIWAPEWDVMVSGVENPSWLYAVNCDTHMLVTLWTPDGVISQHWEKARKGFNNLTVSLPAGVDEATLSVMATGNYRQESGRVIVRRADSMKGLRIVAETFRDRTVPGEEESWTFRVVDLKGNGREAAVIADMYNTALDALASTDWSFSAMTAGQRSFGWNLSTLNGTNGFYYNVPMAQARLRCPDLVEPDFNTYGRSFRNVRIRGIRPLMSARMSTGSVNGIETMYDEEIIVEEKAALAESAPIANDMMKTADAGMGSDYDSVDNVIEHKDAVNVTEKEQFSYRESNVPLAFFRPSLVTDREGKLVLKFTVPNANTTWGFRAVAFTDSLLSAKFSSNVVASKKIMVQPNLPRFLRTGDRAVVKASVMNATSDVQRVETVVELYDPSDGKVLYSMNRPDTIAPDGHKVVDVEISVPSDMPLLGYRIKSSTETFADGEQALIPVLPSVTPVIETYPFYMAPDQRDFSMKLPEMPSDSRVTLQFCENPVWYVVTALPGLLNKDATSAPEAARSIFSAAVASGLLRDNPVIAAALKEWNEGDKSSEMLTSMLERNEDLKIMLLNATPWMLDARNDTERMARLALLFDKNTVDRTLDANISLLKKLAHKNGGWSWCEQYREPSMWATREVLWMMGRLVALGFMPDDGGLRKMIAAALDWDTSETLRDYRKYPDGDYTRYMHLHDMFARMGVGEPDVRIANATTQRILSTWRRESLAGKAVAAQVLYKNNYKSVARELLASIRQFGEKSPEKGMWFPSLDDNAWYGSMGKLGITSLVLETFAMIEPGCVDIDDLRQWLILQKGSQDWGSSAAASEVVAAILSTSGKWITPAEGSKVRVGGLEMTPDRVERMTGEYKISLNASESSGKRLSVKKSGDTPSWGAVFCQYVDNMTSVKAQGCPELNITKELLVNTDPGEGTLGRQAVVKTDSLAVGDRVTVRLVLKVDKDMDYVAIIDDRPACFEPVEQLPSPMYSEGICFYRENRDASTRIFIDHLPKGTYILTYDMWVNNAGVFTSGIATAQSEYAPQYSAHSAGNRVCVK